MPRYTVRTAISIGFGRKSVLQTTLSAASARAAINAGHRQWNRDGYDGPFLGTSAENVDDAHDYESATLGAEPSQEQTG